MVVLSKQTKIAAISAVLLLDEIKKTQALKLKKNKSLWDRNRFKKIKSHGFFHVLMKDLQLFDQVFKNDYREV